MKEPTYRSLLRVLDSNRDWKKSSELSRKLNVSDRTIRKSVAKCNQLWQVPLIESSRQGYRLISQNYERYQSVEATNEGLPDNKSERQIFLIRELLSTTSQCLNLYDLGDELYVSTSTVRGDCQEIKLLMADFDITLTIKGDNVFILGDERSKRALMHHLAYDETTHKLNQRENIQKILGDNIPIEELQAIISDACLARGYLINGYTLDNLLLHFAIVIQRIKENKSLAKKELLPVSNNDVGKKLAEDVSRELSKQYGVHFSESEVAYLSLLFIGRTTLSNLDEINLADLSGVVKTETIERINKILVKVEQVYLIDLKDERFYLKFLLHVENLLFRASANRLTHNPIAEDIKRTYPLIYDISVFIASEIGKIWTILVNEDEIAYIALHIGSFFEEKNSRDKRVRCRLVSPKYYNIHRTLMKQLINKYQEEIDIVEIVTEIPSEYSTKPIDLTLSTTKLSGYTGDLVIINPFLTYEDKKKIDQAISAIRSKKKQQLMTSYMKDYLRADLFLPGVTCDSKEAAIELLGGVLIDKGLAPANFTEKVFEREDMSSTAFGGGVAMPHSLEMIASTTSIAVLITDKPFKWDDKWVQIVALIAINSADRELFSIIFESFINSLAIEENIQRLLPLKNYSDFIETLSQCMYF